MNKKYCLVVTDDYSIFTWVFFLASKDETCGILKNFITEIENLVDKKVKIIRCDNGTKFKNRVMNEFCEQKGINREYSVARTPQQNGVAERRNRTLIEAARTMLADFKLPSTFWAEAVNTACYVLNRVIIVKPHNKTPYELFRGRTPALRFMRPFRCHVSILNTLDHLGKFDGKSNDGYFVGYSLTSKAFRVYNIRTRRVEENLHIRFLEDKRTVSGDDPKWLFDIDSLTKSMNYVMVIAGTNSNDFAGSKVSISKGSTSKEADTSQEYIVMPLWKDSSLFDSPSMNIGHDEPEASSATEKRDDEGISITTEVDNQGRPESSTPNINTAGPSINTTSPNPRTGSLNINNVSPTVITTRSNRPQTVSDIFSMRDNVTPEATNVDLFSDETEMDMSNLNASYQVPTTPTTRIHKDHSLDQVIGDIQTRVQTRGMTKATNGQGLLSVAYERKPYKDLNTCMFFCFLSQEEPKRVTKSLSDSSWVEAMQEELLQFKLQKVWVLVDLPKGKRAIDTKWIFKNKKDKRGIVIRNKARLVYVDDIIFGSTNKELCLEFEKLIHDKFQMSSIGELTFFLDVRTASIPMDTEKPLLKDSDGDDVDVHLYRSMIGSLMYLTSSRLNIMFAKDDEGFCKASGVDDQERPKSSTPNINTAGPSINTASTNLRTGSLHINTVSTTVLTTRNGYEQPIASFMFPTTSLNTIIHKDHSLDHVIGDIQSGVQIRGMIKNANKQRLLSVAYERKPHEDLNTSRIKAIRLFLAYASFMGFMVYQMDVKSAFLYGQIEEERKDRSDLVYQEAKGGYFACTVKHKEDGIFISQDKYVTGILKKFGFQDVMTTSTPMDTEKPLLKDSDGDDVDVHLYRSMIGSLMYLTSSRPDIMFAVCACARFQVTPKVSHSHAVKRIFRYLKGKPKLGLWYPRDSPFDLVAYFDSDYARASLDRKSTTGGCQFLGCNLISWQCKKQTVVATSSTEAEYVADASCCG
ncbi:putative ribonuclease H-like domain-containing protein [Tanacetum coccineum]